MLRIPHFVDSRFTDGGEVVSITHRPQLLPRNSISQLLCSFLVEAEQTAGGSAAGRIRQIKNNYSPLRVSNP
jgi:hypothetical protein